MGNGHSETKATMEQHLDLLNLSGSLMEDDKDKDNNNENEGNKKDKNDKKDKDDDKDKDESGTEETTTNWWQPCTTEAEIKAVLKEKMDSHDWEPHISSAGASGVPFRCQRHWVPVPLEYPEYQKNQKDFYDLTYRNRCVVVEFPGKDGSIRGSLLLESTTSDHAATVTQILPSCAYQDYLFVGRQGSVLLLGMVLSDDTYVNGTFDQDGKICRLYFAFKPGNDYIYPTVLKGQETIEITFDHANNIFSGHEIDNFNCPIFLTTIPTVEGEKLVVASVSDQEEAVVANDGDGARWKPEVGDCIEMMNGEQVPCVQDFYRHWSCAKILAGEDESSRQMLRFVAKSSKADSTNLELDATKSKLLQLVNEASKNFSVPEGDSTKLVITKQSSFSCVVVAEEANKMINTTATRVSVEYVSEGFGPHANLRGYDIIIGKEDIAEEDIADAEGNTNNKLTKLTVVRFLYPAAKNNSSENLPGPDAESEELVRMVAALKSRRVRLNHEIAALSDELGARQKRLGGLEEVLENCGKEAAKYRDVGFMKTGTEFFHLCSHKFFRMRNLRDCLEA